jgi:class 3 adenylate cyclase
VRCNCCGFDNREGARFCLVCGDKLEHCCPACGVTVPPSARYCDACGHRMPGEVEAVRIDFNHPRSYTPKPMADKIAGLRHSIEGERKLVTVLFADLAHYTSICENLDPEEIHQMMDAYFKLLIDAVYAYEGIITQFAGDGIMALFGAPLAHEDHAQRACYTALRMRASFGEYAHAMRQKHNIELVTRVGINSGTVIVGLVGDDLRMDYTALGDTINLASRLETMATPGSILVSHNTYRITKDFFRFTSLGKVKVRGKKAPLEAFELLETGPVETRLGASLARGLTRFVGRERELLTLKNAFGKAVSGSGQLIGLVGEAGVGKSRLALELRNSLEGLPHIYLEGRCFHFGSSIAYLPILDILRSLFKVKEGEKEQRVKESIEDTIRDLDWRIRYVIQPLYDLFSLEVEDAAYLKLEPKKRREKVFEAVRDLLIRKSQE